MSADRQDDGPLLLGIDCGTSRIKAGVYSIDGLCVGFGATPVPTQSDGLACAWHDPEAIWLATVLAIRTALSSGIDPQRIVGAACASVGEAALLVDKTGAALTPIIAWFDRRGADTCKAWIREIGADQLYALTGQPPESILSAYKLAWLRQNERAAYEAAAAWVTLADYIAFRLCGVLSAERSLACRTGALRIADGSWAHTLLEHRRLDPGLFLPLRNNGAPLAQLRPQAALATGLSQSCVVGIGGYDQALGALICSGYQDDTLSVSMGSTEAQVLPVARHTQSHQLLQAAICQGMLVIDAVPQRFLLSGIYTAGSAIEWLRQKLFDGQSHAELIAMAEATSAGSRGVGFLPHLLISAQPDSGSGTHGTFWGLGLATDRGALYRAVLEGLGYEGRLCTEAMASAAGTGSIGRIRAVGGDTENALRLKIKAAIAGVPIEVFHVRNASGLGAAVMGGLAAGVYRSVKEARAQFALPLTHIPPEPELARFYDHAYTNIYRKAASLLAALNGSAAESR
jgi:xylulokinase